MNPILIKILLKFKFTLYAIRENDFVGFYVNKLEAPEDKPHIGAFLDGSHYIPYNEVFFFKSNADKFVKQKTQLTFEEQYKGNEPENISLAENLSRSGLITGYREFNDVVKNGKDSVYYKNLYGEE